MLRVEVSMLVAAGSNSSSSKVLDSRRHRSEGAVLLNLGRCHVDWCHDQDLLPSLIPREPRVPARGFLLLYEPYTIR